ncbi:MAG: RNA methyltransferase [Chloroflexi bacterium]|nr:MAG: RNA methyltransferase [Chloroflexota bacterium]
MTLTLFADGVENPANLSRIDDAARLLGASCSQSITGRLIAVENAAGASEIYGRRPLRGDATLAVGNERRGVSRKTLAAADEIVVIPTQSRTVNTLNVAAAAAVGAWYVLRGSGPQARAMRPETRRPWLMIVGDDHVEVGSSLRSAAAFGFHDVLLEDRGADWFDGTSAVRREARAAARRHKNPLRIHPTSLDSASRYEEIVLVTPSGPGISLHRLGLTHGKRQLIIVGARPDEMRTSEADRMKIATLGLESVGPAPLRLIASILLAEIARQVGRRRPVPGIAPRPPKFEKGLELIPAGEILFIEPSALLEF